MSTDNEVDMKTVELAVIDPEKQPMNIASDSSEKNGCVKVKVADDQEVKFTGLSKEELLKVANTPCWVRTRWALLILFWLGWIGMLAGAIVIIVQAPRCKPLPSLKWWQKGAIYQIGAVESFDDTKGNRTGNIAGVKARIDYLSALKVKGVVIGPIHKNSADLVLDTNLEVIDEKFGNEADFLNLLDAAKKKGIHVVLDLTPNYNGMNEWFNSDFIRDPDIVKKGMEYWLNKGVSGIRFGNVDAVLQNSYLLEEWRNITSNYSSEGKERVLILSAIQLPNNTNPFVDGVLFTDGTLKTLGEEPTANTVAEALSQYIEHAPDQWLGWMVGVREVGHMASQVINRLHRLYQLMLFTLPGTPFTNYGDEIGLLDTLPKSSNAKFPVMQWKYQESKDSGPRFANETVEGQEKDADSLLNLYKALSDLKVKERSLQHGDFHIIQNSSEIFAYLRDWDQNDRFLAVLNFANYKTSVDLKDSSLPLKTKVVLSSDPKRQNGEISLQGLELSPSEGLLLSFPYVS